MYKALDFLVSLGHRKIMILIKTTYLDNITSNSLLWLKQIVLTPMTFIIMLICKCTLTKFEIT